MNQGQALMGRYIFHLSIPVDNLDSAAKFYVDVLGAELGRSNPEWIDILLWGHQITLQLRPHEVLSLEAQGKRHLGVVLPWDVWVAEVERLKAAGVRFLRDPEIRELGTPEEQAKLYLSDTSNNIIEIKAYRNFCYVLGTTNAAYAYGA